MSKCIYLFLTILCFASCTRTGYYYVNKLNSEEEYVSISDESIKKVGLAANIIDSSFNVIVFFKLLDSSGSKVYNVDDISFWANGLSSVMAKKRILFIDRPLKVEYENLADVDDLAERIRTGLPLEFLFEFDQKLLKNNDKIQVDVKVSILEDGKKVQLKKVFQLVRRSSYRLGLATK